jgi:hypothetical protein
MMFRLLAQFCRWVDNHCYPSIPVEVFGFEQIGWYGEEGARAGIGGPYLRYIRHWTDAECDYFYRFNRHADMRRCQFRRLAARLEYLASARKLPFFRWVRRVWNNLSVKYDLPTNAHRSK